MSLVAPIVDGKLQTSSASSESLKKSSDKSKIDSDTFLTLLVAQMQNQDPLEPTSNTEWVAQFATFTQVEKITEMGDSMDLLRANSLIGKEVVMKVTSESTGETSYKRGVVDYVTVEDGKAYLVIDEEKFSMSDLDSVASEEYFTAYDKYSEFTGMLDALPSLKLVDKSYENTIGKIYELYNSLTPYQKDYIDKYASGYVESYKAYLDKMKQLGITFDKKEEEKPATSLEDILEAFNKRMDELTEQINKLTQGGGSSKPPTDNGGSEEEVPPITDNDGEEEIPPVTGGEEEVPPTTDNDNEGEIPPTTDGSEEVPPTTDNSGEGEDSSSADGGSSAPSTEDNGSL